MVVHQAPGEAARAARGARLGQQREIGAAVVVGKEHGQEPVAALGDVMRDMRDDDAAEAGHRRGLAGSGGGGK